ncbi:MAG TPA: hypothetical protein VMZ11_02445 [Mycobacteriales bacterium]|nr:hypothetical protein [Mycobacteriales bacterium]
MFTLPKAAGTAVLALSVSVVALPAAAPAYAAAPVEKAFVIADTDVPPDSFSGLYSQPTPTGALHPEVSEALPLDIHDLTSSADGTRVAYVQDNYSTTTGAPVSSQVVVKDVSGRFVRIVEQRTWDDIHFLGAPALSPNGNTVLWELYDADADTVTLRKAAAGWGKASTLHADLSPYGFLDAGTVLAQDSEGTPYTLSVNGGDTHPVNPPLEPDLPPNAINVAIAPDLQHIAWGLFDTSVPVDQPQKSSMHVATYTVDNGVATVGTATTVTSSLFNDQPSFSRDSATLYWIQSNGEFGAAGDIWSAPVAGGPAAPTATTAADENDVAITGTDDGTAPGQATPLAAGLNGTSITLHWQLPADADISGVLITRKLSGVVKKTVFVPAPTSSYVDTGLVLGATYNYTYTAIDRSGNAAAATNRNASALRPIPHFADPTSQTSTKAAFPVSFTPAAPSNATFNVDYLPIGASAWSHWVTGATGRARVFGVAGTTKVASTTSTPGTSYAFRVQIKDAYGNATGWVGSGRAVVPVDQTKATLVGGVNVASSSAYLGSFRKLSHTTDYARITLKGNRLQVVGWKCSTCGKVGVYDGATLVATVDTFASSTKPHTVLYTRTYGSVGSHTFTLRPLATPGRPNVELDGFAMRR